MGYMRNHLATVSTAAFAAVLTGLWPWFSGWTGLLDFIFLMAVPIAWFMALTCWLAQKSADYVKDHSEHADTKNKELESMSERVDKLKEQSDDRKEQDSAKAELSSELDSLRANAKVKDDEIERLRGQVSKLETRVQIEALRAEIADLKAMAKA